MLYISMGYYSPGKPLHALYDALVHGCSRQELGLRHKKSLVLITRGPLAPGNRRAEWKNPGFFQDFSAASLCKTGFYGVALCTYGNPVYRVLRTQAMTLTLIKPNSRQAAPIPG